MRSRFTGCWSTSPPKIRLFLLLLMMFGFFAGTAQAMWVQKYERLAYSIPDPQVHRRSQTAAPVASRGEVISYFPCSYGGIPYPVSCGSGAGPRVFRSKKGFLVCVCLCSAEAAGPNCLPD
uniref:Secreted protein n=1 Tax=Macrostomum lignano TaxID=282301 RepID=A0A1I8HGG9_9PLAT